MQLGAANFKLPENAFDAAFDARVIGAIAGDEFFDDCPQCPRRQQLVGNTHETCLLTAARNRTSHGTQLVQK